MRLMERKLDLIERLIYIEPDFLDHETKNHWIARVVNCKSVRETEALTHELDLKMFESMQIRSAGSVTKKTRHVSLLDYMDQEDLEFRKGGC